MAFARDDAVDDDFAARAATSGIVAANGFGVEIREAGRESLGCFFEFGSVSTLPSFCSTIGVMTMLFAPSSLHLLENFLLGAVADREHRDDRRDAEQNAERREPRAQLVVGDRLSRGAGWRTSMCAISFWARDGGGAPGSRQSSPRVSPWAWRSVRCGCRLRRRRRRGSLCAGLALRLGSEASRSWRYRRWYPARRRLEARNDLRLDVRLCPSAASSSTRSSFDSPCFTTISLSFIAPVSIICFTTLRPLFL